MSSEYLMEKEVVLDAVLVSRVVSFRVAQNTENSCNVSGVTTQRQVHSEYSAANSSNLIQSADVYLCHNGHYRIAVATNNERCLLARQLAFIHWSSFNLYARKNYLLASPLTQRIPNTHI